MLLIDLFDLGFSTGWPFSACVTLKLIIPISHCQFEIIYIRVLIRKKCVHMPGTYIGVQHNRW